jgi:hypothetical protein
MYRSDGRGLRVAWRDAEGYGSAAELTTCVVRTLELGCNSTIILRSSGSFAVIIGRTLKPCLSLMLFLNDEIKAAD